VRRRDLLSRGAAGALALASAAFIAPETLRAQTPRNTPLRLALLSGAFGVDELTEAGTLAFGMVLNELRRLGFVEGQNMIVERWSNRGRPESELLDLAKRAAASQPHIIYVTASSAIAAVKAATSTIPVVFVGADPIGWGFVESLRRPGGNLTGFSTDAGAEFYMKQLQLLTEAARTNRVVYLFTDATKDTPLSQAVRAAARQLGVELRPAMVEGAVSETSISSALSAASPGPAMALYVHPAVVLDPFAKFIAAEALRFRLPAMSTRRLMAESGLVMTYNSLEEETYRGAAGYIARIARGDNPAELPVQFPTRFEFVINLKTAKALGIAIPEHIMVFATEVIE
jgi:putative tryptophan/tyrosine transport system substrate-binding protein